MKDRLEYLQKIADLSQENRYSLDDIMHGNILKKLEETAGIYAFWLEKKASEFQKLNLCVTIPGKNRKNGRDYHHLKWDWNHHLTFIPQYIGKSTVIGKRVRQHLDAYSITDWFNNAPKDPQNLLFRRNSTVNQFRAGLEQLFRGSGIIIPKGKSILEYKKNDVFLTFVELGNEQELIEERFFLEDFAIGYYKPWFNVDSER